MVAEVRLFCGEIRQVSVAYLEKVSMCSNVSYRQIRESGIWTSFSGRGKVDQATIRLVYYNN